MQKGLSAAQTRASEHWQLAARKAALIWVVAASCLLLFASPLDQLIYEHVRAMEPEFRRDMRWYTDFGKSHWMLLSTAAVIAVLSYITSSTDDPGWRSIVGHYANRVAFIFASVAGAGIAAMLLKGIIGRARPKLFASEGILAFDPFAFTSKWASFPSGHTTNIFALAAAITAIWPRTGWIVLPLAAAIASTRVFVGAHHPTDVTAGALLGCLFVWVARHLAADRGWVFRRDAAGAIKLSQRWAAAKT